MQNNISVVNTKIDMKYKFIRRTFKFEKRGYIGTELIS